MNRAHCINALRRDFRCPFKKPVYPGVVAGGYVEPQPGTGLEVRAKDIAGREHDAFLDCSLGQRCGIEALRQSCPNEQAPLRFVEQGQATRLQTRTDYFPGIQKIAGDEVQGRSAPRGSIRSAWDSL